MFNSLSTLFQLVRGAVLLVEETEIPGENHENQVIDKLLSHSVVSRTPRHERG